MKIYKEKSVWRQGGNRKPLSNLTTIQGADGIDCRQLALHCPGLDISAETPGLFQFRASLNFTGGMQSRHDDDPRLFPLLIGRNLPEHSDGRRRRGIRGIAAGHQQGGAFDVRAFLNQGEKTVNDELELRRHAEIIHGRRQRESIGFAQFVTLFIQPTVFFHNCADGSFFGKT